MRNAIIISFIAYQSFTSALADEIIITAERRDQNLTTAPLSISKVDTAALTKLNADHAAESLNTVAGVYINRGSGQEHLTSIRSPVLTGGAGAGSFLYLENGIPLRAAGFANVNGLLEAQLPLASSIEVIRGPSGAFYGANAIHGVVNVLTPNPDENVNSASVAISPHYRKAHASISRHNRGEGFYAGLAITDDIGFRSDSGADQQNLTIRHVSDKNDWQRDVILTVSNLNQETAGFAQGENIYHDRASAKINPNPEAYRDVQSVRLQSSFTKDMDTGELILTPYLRHTNMEFLQHFLPSKAVEKNSHASLGLQSAWYGNNGLKVGFDGEYTKGELSEFQSRPTIFSYVQGLHYDYDVSATSLSPFIQYDHNISPSLTLSLAGRADWTRYVYNNNTTSDQVGRFVRPADRNDEFLTLSPKASIVKETNNGAAWLGVTSGARPPQTTDLYRLQSNQQVTEVEPETIRSVEMGWRGQLNDQTTLAISLYSAYKENFLFRDADGFNVIDGKTKHQGVEAEINFNPSEIINISSSLSYAEHTYRFDRAVASTRNATEAIAKGDDIDTAPRTLANTQTNWQMTEDISTQLSWEHVGQYFMDASNSRKYPGHNIFALRAEKQHGFFTSFAAIKNITDERYATRADFAFGSERYFPGEGRTLTLGVRFKN